MRRNPVSSDCARSPMSHPNYSSHPLQYPSPEQFLSASLRADLIQHAENFTERAQTRLQHSREAAEDTRPQLRVRENTMDGSKAREPKVQVGGIPFADQGGDRATSSVEAIRTATSLPTRSPISQSAQPQLDEAPQVQRRRHTRSTSMSPSLRIESRSHAPLFYPRLGPKLSSAKVDRSPPRNDMNTASATSQEQALHRQSLNLTLNLEQKLFRMEAALKMQKDHLQRLDQETRHTSVFMSEIASASSLEEIAGSIFSATHSMKSADGSVSCIQLKSALTQFPPFYSWLHHKGCWAQWGGCVDATEFDALMRQFFFSTGSLQGRELQNVLDARLLQQAHPSWCSDRSSVRGHRVLIPQMAPQSARTTLLGGQMATPRCAQMPPVYIHGGNSAGSSAIACAPAKNARAWREEAEKWRHKYKKRARDLEEASILCEERSVESRQWKQQCAELEASQELLRTENANLQRMQQAKDPLGVDDPVGRFQGANARLGAEGALRAAQAEFEEAEAESARYSHLYDIEVRNGQRQEEHYELNQRLFSCLLAEKEEELASKHSGLGASTLRRDANSLVGHYQGSELQTQPAGLASPAEWREMERELAGARARLDAAEEEISAAAAVTKEKEFSAKLLTQLRLDLEKARLQTRDALSQSARSATEFAAQRQIREAALLELKNENTSQALDHEREIVTMERKIRILETGQPALQDQASGEIVAGGQAAGGIRLADIKSQELQGQLAQVEQQLVRALDEQVRLDAACCDFEQLLEATQDVHRRSEEDLERTRRELREERALFSQIEHERNLPGGDKGAVELEDCKRELEAEQEKCQILGSQVAVQAAYRETIDAHKEALANEQAELENKYKAASARAADLECAQRLRSDNLLAELESLRREGAAQREEASADFNVHDEREQCLERECSDLRSKLRQRDLDIMGQEEVLAIVTDEMQSEQGIAHRRMRRDDDRLAALQQAVESSLEARRDASATIDRLSRELQEQSAECEKHRRAALAGDGAALLEQTAKDVAERDACLQKELARRLQVDVESSRSEVAELRELRCELETAQLDQSRESNRELKAELHDAQRQLFDAQETEVVQARRVCDSAQMTEFASERAQAEIDEIRGENLELAKSWRAEVEVLDCALRFESAATSELREEARVSQISQRESEARAIVEETASVATQEQLAHTREELAHEKARGRDLEERCASESAAAMRLARLEFELVAEKSRTRELQGDIERISADLANARERALSHAAAAEDARSRSVGLQDELRTVLANSEKSVGADSMSGSPRHFSPLAAYPSSPPSIFGAPFSPPPFGDKNCPWKKQVTLATPEGWSHSADAIRGDTLSRISAPSTSSIARIHTATENAIETLKQRGDYSLADSVQHMGQELVSELSDALASIHLSDITTVEDG